ncbi:MAG: FxsA family protein [Myxococcota bacterium]
MSRLFLLLVSVPLLELWLLLRLADAIGAWWTLGMVIGTAAIGSALARREGLKTFHEVNRQMSQGVMPTDALLDGLAIFFGAGMLMTPGILTDLLGFALLLPITRQRLRRILAHQIRRRIVVMPAPDFRQRARDSNPETSRPASRKGPTVIDQKFD